MSAHTKTRRIRRKIKSRKTGNKKNIPWRESAKNEIQKYSEAGLMLKGCRYKAGITQKILAEAIDISPHHISEMEHGKRPIGKAMAKRLAEYFKIDYRIFL